MDVVHIVVIVAALLCGTVAGLLFGFAVVAMPGLRSLPDRDFLTAFKAMDRVIQERQPLFMTVWIGSVLAAAATGILGFTALDGADRVLAVAAAGVYLGGVQLPTAAVNIPLNNAVQALDLEAMNDVGLREAREAFEPAWNRWNGIRTSLGGFATVLLLTLLLRLVG